MSQLSAIGVSRTYQRGSEIIRAVDDVTLHLEPGVVTVLQGPSGSGKTTLLNLLAGWERPDAGHIEWEGTDRDPSGLGWTDLSVVPQRVGLLSELSAIENVTLAARVRREATDLDGLFARFGLEELEHAFPDELSAGQQQRVAITRALADRPAVVLVDEPTSSQDEENAHLVLGEFRRLASEGGTCLIASHDPIALDYANRVIRMRDGRLEGD
ncbi:MAG: ATP-binding cassette domain-containing protein [Acidimicrobiia bacterium]|nr:ATP-binding cassette domain-containing protein [Acidimicrobiia bacterium]